MKTGLTPKREPKSPRAKSGLSADDEIAVLVDTWTHTEYYLHVIDAFPAFGQEYVVMVPYQLDDGTRKVPEIVVFKTLSGANAEKVYIALHSRKERKAVFEVFLSRFESAGGL